MPVFAQTTTPAGHPYREIVRAFLKLGLISFGGPVAHIGFLRDEFVRRRRWIEDADYADLVALCQFLPGPASSQLVFALGMRRAGWLGALLASLCFTLPSAVLMIALGTGVATLGDLHGAGFLAGLKLAAVAVVAQAVLAMGRSLCPDRARLGLALLAGAALLIVPGAASQLTAILTGALIGWAIYRNNVKTETAPAPANGGHHLVACAMLAVFFLLLALLPVLSSVTGNKDVAAFDSFYRAGSLVFGGGHVILPLLRAEVVPNGWVSGDVFLAGYGAAQALPGPLFTFTGYLGAAMNPGPGAWLHGLWCLLAIFLPAWLLIGGTLPFWHRLRSMAWVQAALRGANAAVVGILFAALCNPVWTESVSSPTDAAIAFAGFALLQWGKCPPWLVVLLTAAARSWTAG